jgi:hypothetical protein
VCASSEGASPLGQPLIRTDVFEMPIGAFSRFSMT